MAGLGEGLFGACEEIKGTNNMDLDLLLKVYLNNPFSLSLTHLCICMYVFQLCWACLAHDFGASKSYSGYSI